MCLRMIRSFAFISIVLCIITGILLNPSNICKSDCKKLKYQKPCLLACEQYIEYIQNSTTENNEPVPSNIWYGLTNKYRDVSDENTGIYLSLQDDYLVKYMKVNSLYIKNSPWNKIYSNEFKKKMENLDNYEWYLPSIMPLYMLPVYQHFVDYVLITITENTFQIGKTQSNFTVALFNESKYYFYLDIDPRGIGIKFFGRLK